MKPTFLKITKEQREDGSLLSYVWYLAAIFTIAIIFSYSTFLADLFLIESTLNNNLHIAESASITTSLNSSGYIETDKILIKLKAVTASDASTSSISTYELNQVKIISNCFVNTLSEQLSLNGASPVGGILKDRCTSDSKVQILSFIIYEPEYKVVKTKQNNPNATEEEDPFVEKDVIFNIDYQINNSKWIKYTVTFSATNEYSTVKKELLSSAPKLHDGRYAEGATIQATIGLQLKGVPNIFYNAANGNSLNQTSYAIQVTQAVDAVLANKDSRDTGN